MTGGENALFPIAQHGGRSLIVLLLLSFQALFDFLLPFVVFSQTFLALFLGLLFELFAFFSGMILTLMSFLCDLAR